MAGDSLSDRAPSLVSEDWPTWGWAEDVRPALATALDAGRSVVLATLFRVQGSAPRGPGTQMLFDGESATGFFSGGCVEGDVASHAREVLRDGAPRTLHYGMGSPWIDIKLTCGGAIHIFLERVAGDSRAARDLLARGEARRSALWLSDGRHARVEAAGTAPVLTTGSEPFAIARRYDPRWRLVVSGRDPTTLAIAKLGVDTGFETFLACGEGPCEPLPFAGVERVCASSPAATLKRIGVDAWTAFVGATHNAELDIPGCAAALSAGAGYVGLVGAAARAPDRKRAIAAMGISPEVLARLRAPAGLPHLGKAPWSIAVGIVGEIMQVKSQDPLRV